VNGVAAGSFISRDRLILIAVALAAMVLGIGFYSRDSWPLVVEGIVVEGSIGAIWLLSATLLGDVVAARLGVSGLLRWCTAAGLGLGFFSLAMLAMGLAGVLGFGSCVALLLLAAGVGLADFYLSKKKLGWERSADSHASWQWLWLLIVPFAVVALVGTNVFPAVLWWPNDPHPYDVLSYHLQVPREWYEMGRIAPLRHNMYSFFPFAAEMNYLLAMYIRGGPWNGMYLAQLMSFIYMLLAVLAVAAAMPTRPGGIMAAVAMGIVPWTAQLAAMAYNESALLLYVALAAAWMMRALTVRMHLIRDMAVAGVIAGLACGVKYTAAPTVLVGLAVAAGGAALLHCRAELKRVMIGAAVSLLAGLLVFSPWLIRNAIWAGNPVFPLEMRQLGRAHFTPEQVERFERAHRAVPENSSIPARLAAFWREVAADWRFGWFLLPMGLISAAINWRRADVAFLVFGVVVMALFWMGMTHLMGRFFVPALPLLAMLIGYLAMNPRGAPISAAVLVLMAITTFYGLHHEFSLSLEKRYAYEGLFRLRNPSLLWPPELADIEKTGGKLALIGDAQAFYRPLPMTRLEYRTIFDVVVPPGKNIVDAWLGRDLDDLRQDHYILLNPGELNRLSQTYYGIPPVPPQWQRRNDETIILAPTGRR
jgi:hypothetical protein